MKTPILYSFRRCPYAIRARWALMLCGIKVNIREVSLKNKPLELIKASSKGTVPVLIKENGEVLDESLEIIIWAIESAKAVNNLHLADEFINEEILYLIKQNDNLFKYHLDRYKYPNRFKGIDPKIHHKNSEIILKDWDEKIKKSKFGLIGKEETLADWCIWPFVRQYRLININEFDNKKEFANIRGWLNLYLNHRLFPKLMEKYNFWETSTPDILFP